MRTCSNCSKPIGSPESVAAGLCVSCRWRMTFQPKRVEPEFHPQVAPPAFVLALADRILAAHEVLARRAERRAWDGTEADYCPLGEVRS